VLQKNLSVNQLLLLGLATVLFLMAAFALYLLQDLSAPLPFEPPSPTSTITPPPSITPTASATSTPTHRTSYTPFAHTATQGTGTPPGTPLGTPSGTPSGTPATSQAASPTPSSTPSPTTPAITSTGSPVSTPTRTITPTPPPDTPTPSPTATLALGEVNVTGRVVRNGIAVAGVVVAFKDDEASRLDTTDANGNYGFVTLAPGTSFTLAFYQVNNPQLTPASEIALTALIEGDLPIGANPIQLPDLEVSINLNGVMFELQGPADGTSYSAAAISLSNPIQFDWSLYYQAENYFVELGASGSDDVSWNSAEVVPTNLMWDGTLGDGSHVTSGTYWWHAAAGKSLPGDYWFISYSQDLSIVFTP